MFDALCLFNISNEKIEPLNFCEISCEDTKSYVSINLFDWWEFDVTMKFQTGLLRMLPGEPPQNYLLYKFPYILVHVKKKTVQLLLHLLPSISVLAKSWYEEAPTCKGSTENLWIYCRIFGQGVFMCTNDFIFVIVELCVYIHGDVELNRCILTVLCLWLLIHRIKQRKQSPSLFSLPYPRRP